MRNPVIILTVLFFSSFLACQKVEKDVNNYYPKVKTTGVELLPDGNVKVTGAIISSGTTDIQYAGFCMDTLPNPGMLSNQKSVTTLNGNTFTATYTSLDKLHTYYFRAWAANADGYVIGEDVKIDSVGISPVTIPCNPSPDTLVVSKPSSTTREHYYSIGPIKQSVDGWEIKLTTGSYSVYVEFGQKPVNGVYKVQPQHYPSKGKFATVRLGGFAADASTNIYVDLVNSTTIEVIICDVVVSDPVPHTLTTKFRASY